MAAPRERNQYGKSKMMNTSTLLWGVIFGSIGLGFFVYGKKQHAVIPLFSGIGLMVFPYFISNPYIIVLTGIVLVALPYFVRI
jgi:hypothetical protein